MNLEPEGVKLLVLPEKVKDQTEGGIWRPDDTKDREQVSVTKGVVVAIGPDVESKFETGPIDIDDTIIYAKYGGAGIENDGIEYRLINDEDVLVRLSA